MNRHIVDDRDDSKLHDVCAGRLTLLDDVEVTEWLTELPTWNVADHQLKRTFECANFDQSVKFIQKIAYISEILNHHPDLCLHGKKSVKVTLWTRQMGGLTSVDFDLAVAINTAYWSEFSERGAQ